MLNIKNKIRTFVKHNKKELVNYTKISAFGVISFLLLKPYVTADRGYEGLGGEGILLILPIFYYLGKGMYLDIKKDFKEVWRLFFEA